MSTSDRRDHRHDHYLPALMPALEARIAALDSGAPAVLGDFEGQQRSLFEYAVLFATYTRHVEAIDAHIERVDLRRVGPLRSAIGLPLFGRLGGDVDLNIGDLMVNITPATIRTLSSTLSALSTPQVRPLRHHPYSQLHPQCTQYNVHPRCDHPATII